MKYKKLGITNLDVSLICLGTMTWGTQNSEKDAFEQMDYSISKGINFFDTAEIYSVPPTADSYGKTEEMIGNWFKKRKNREKIILASKVAGPGCDWIRGGGNSFGGQLVGAGGKGVVILSVPTASYSGTTSGSPTVTTSGSNTIMQFNGSGSYTG